MLLQACAPSPLKQAAPPKPAPYRSGPLAVGVWGVGPIRATTYFESPVIGALFPAAQVSDGTVRVSDDETTAVITVTQGGVEMLEIDDGTGNAPGTNDPMIGSVRALGGPVRGPQGERLGMSWNDARFDLTECDLGSDRDRNTVFCARPGEGAVTYQFAVPGYDSEEVPPESLLRKVAYVKAIVWTPPATSH
ncbi:MAG TPA: DUF1131 domain-containing protein [Caulobacteraceae bacterium]|nr:DUF1131 domain-containing protein [Caulobacteraceae bacterium]